VVAINQLDSAWCMCPAFGNGKVRRIQENGNNLPWRINALGTMRAVLRGAIVREQQSIAIKG